MASAGRHRQPWPADYPERARRMRAEGMKYREIIAALRIPQSTLARWLTDPDGKQGRARKDSYRGVCIDCGDPTSGSNGRHQAPARCAKCSPFAHRKWSRELIVERIQEWARRYGEPPGAAAWTIGAYGHDAGRYQAGDWPASAVVQHYFGSWNAAIEAAGHEPLQPGHYRDRRKKLMARYTATNAIDRDIETTQERITALREEIAERERYLIGLQAAKDAMDAAMQNGNGTPVEAAA